MTSQAFAIAVLSLLALTTCMWASPGENDLAKCQQRHTREVCIHSVMP